MTKEERAQRWFSNIPNAEISLGMKMNIYSNPYGCCFCIQEESAPKAEADKFINSIKKPKRSRFML